MKKPIITIGREYGSGGREIAMLLANRFQVPLYDKEILAEASKRSGFSENTFEMFDETKESMWFYALATGSTMYGMELPLPVQLCMEQFRTIGEIADKGPCVIVGRCANYVLRGRDDVVSVFIHAPLEKRIERICRLHNRKPQEAEREIQQTDKKRAAYFQHYTDWKWGAASSYNICLDSSKTGIAGSVDILEQYIMSIGNH
ncbi:MAG: cytidylate kinase-like family protein [Oscillospiraceae bacterium]|nr:cytidylate kinase-like family protein [Oscillospiraceae bacterium]